MLQVFNMPEVGQLGALGHKASQLRPVAIPVQVIVSRQVTQERLHL